MLEIYVLMNRGRDRRSVARQVRDSAVARQVRVSAVAHVSAVARQVHVSDHVLIERRVRSQRAALLPVFPVPRQGGSGCAPFWCLAPCQDPPGRPACVMKRGGIVEAHEAHQACS